MFGIIVIGQTQYKWMLIINFSSQNKRLIQIHSTFLLIILDLSISYGNTTKKLNHLKDRQDNR